MPHPPEPKAPARAAGRPLDGLHYLLIFSAFGLLMLVLIGPKYQARQADLEEQYTAFRNIQGREQTQRGAAADPRFQPPAPVAATRSGQPPLLITLRPLMLYAAVAMLCAWGGLQWRRLTQARPARSASPGPFPSSASGEPPTS